MAGSCISSRVVIRKNCSPRLGSGGNGSIEFWNSGLEECYQLGISFISVFSSHLFSILYCFFGSRPGIHGTGTGFTTTGSQSMGAGVSTCAGLAEKLLKSVNRSDEVWVSTRTYAAWLFKSFLSICLVQFMQPRRSAHEERDNVTVEGNRGQEMAMLYSLTVTSLRSLVIVLHVHLHVLSLASTFAPVFL